MKYLLLMYANETVASSFTPEQFQTANQEWMALTKELQDAGVLLGNSGLSPVANATSVRVRDSKTLVTDGPFAETHEQLGGYFLVECSDLDEAISWAAKFPNAKYGTVEVRPLWSGR
ncbi:MAG: YciI family protein [Anaerolineae bacterium]